jgi:UPF0148 protein
MAEKTSDEIMAEYLLKGARMLSRCCPTCGSPLFEVKGETRCVVCAEPRSGGEAAPVKEAIPVAPVREGEGTLTTELTTSLIALCRKAREEPDPERCLILMEAIGEGIEALRRLTQ